MRNVLRAALGAVAAITATAGAAAAQAGSAITISRGQFEASAFSGYLMSEKLIDGPLGTELGSATGTVYGAQIGLPLNPYSAIIGGIAWSSGDLRAGVPILGGIDVGTSRTILYDVAVQVRLAGNSGSRTGAIPFAQLGGGAAQRELSTLGMSAKSTDFIVTGAAGVDVAVMPTVSFRLMAKDHYGPADFGRLGPLDARVEDFHTVTLTAGVRLAF